MQRVAEIKCYILKRKYLKCLWYDSEITSNIESETDTVKFANKEHVFLEAV